MRLSSFYIRNFRRLKNVLIELEPETTIFVGANNSGKTSATHVFQLFFRSGESFTIHDFSADCWKDIDLAGKEPLPDPGSNPRLPAISLDLWFDVQESDIHRVIDLLPSLDWDKAPVGIRIEFAAKNAYQTLWNYIEARTKAEPGKEGEYLPWPKSLTDYLKKTLHSEYETSYYVLDRARFKDNLEPEDDYIPSKFGTDSGSSGKNTLKSLLRIDFLNAQRHLSDSSGSGRAEDLSKRLSNFYKQNLEKQEDDLKALKSLAISESALSNHFSEVFKPTLARLKDLGYPGLSDPSLVIRASFSQESMMSQNAKLHYVLDGVEDPDHVLPDRYNGLGFKNLIYMVIELLDFHAQWNSDDQDSRPPLHLVFIEEPEAHLHTQIQQVFIREIVALLKEEDTTFSSQLVVTTHSPHIIYESGFKPIRYFRRGKTSGVNQYSDVLNLSQFNGEGDIETTKFLLQYMKITHCDLFFADAAILVEGNVERLLLPLMIEKSAPKLKSSYLSILEVGGAFAHKFKTLIKFLGITVLVVTDLDSVTPKSDNTGGGDENEDDSEETGESASAKGKACPAQYPEAVTSNQTLIQWLPAMNAISKLLGADEGKKIQAPLKDSPAHIRVAYQTPRSVNWGAATEIHTGRTLEEAFCLENLEWCQHQDRKPLGLRIKKGESLSLREISAKIFERVNGIKFDKTSFALNLIMEDPADWKVPNYIDEGLKWLSSQIQTPDKTEASKQTDLPAAI